MHDCDYEQDLYLPFACTGRGMKALWGVSSGGSEQGNGSVQIIRRLGVAGLMSSGDCASRLMAVPRAKPQTPLPARATDITCIGIALSISKREFGLISQSARRA